MTDKPYDPDRAFWVWRHYNPRVADDAGAAWAAAISYEQRHAVASMYEFSGLQATLERLITLLENMRVEQQAVTQVAEWLER